MIESGIAAPTSTFYQPNREHLVSLPIISLFSDPDTPSPPIQISDVTTKLLSSCSDVCADINRLMREPHEKHKCRNVLQSNAAIYMFYKRGELVLDAFTFSSKRKSRPQISWVFKQKEMLSRKVGSILSSYDMMGSDVDIDNFVNSLKSSVPYGIIAQTKTNPKWNEYFTLYSNKDIYNNERVVLYICNNRKYTDYELLVGGWFLGSGLKKGKIIAYGKTPFRFGLSDCGYKISHETGDEIKSMCEYNRNLHGLVS